MKYLKLIIFSCIFTSTVSTFTQSNFSGIVYYESKISEKVLQEYLKNKKDSIKYKKLEKTLDKIYFQTKPINSKIVFSNGKGFYKVEDNLNIGKNDIGMEIAKVNAGGSDTYYYNEIDKKYLIKDCETLGDCFIYPNEYLEWQLTQETKIINGYKAFKALRAKGTVIAWYTPKIPVSFGPKGEYGLPGLILELEISRSIFIAKKIILNPKEEIKVEEPKKGKIVSLDEYTKIIGKAKKRVFGNN
jgi:GLPGLI family protein